MTATSAAIRAAGIALLGAVLVGCGGSEQASVDEPPQEPEETLAVVVFYPATTEEERERVIDTCGALEGVEEVVPRPDGSDGPEVALLQANSTFEQRVAVTNCLAAQESVSKVYGVHHPVDE